MRLPSTVQVEEVIWLLLTLVALYYTFQALRQASGDWKVYVEAKKNGRALLVVRAAMRDARIFFSIQLGFLFVGVLSLSRLPSADSRVLSRAFAVTIFLLMQLGLTVIARAITYDRVQFVRLIEVTESTWDGSERRQT